MLLYLQSQESKGGRAVGHRDENNVCKRKRKKLLKSLRFGEKFTWSRIHQVLCGDVGRVWQSEQLTWVRKWVLYIKKSLEIPQKRHYLRKTPPRDFSFGGRPFRNSIMQNQVSLANTLWYLKYQTQKIVLEPALSKCWQTDSPRPCCPSLSAFENKSKNRSLFFRQFCCTITWLALGWGHGGAKEVADKTPWGKCFVLLKYVLFDLGNQKRPFHIANFFPHSPPILCVPSISWTSVLLSAARRRGRL